MCLPQNSPAAAYWHGHNFPRQVGPKGKCLVIGAKPRERLQGDSWSQQCWGGQVLGHTSSGWMRGEFIWCYSKPRQRSVRQQHFNGGTMKVSHSSSTWARSPAAALQVLPRDLSVTLSRCIGTQGCGGPAAWPRNRPTFMSASSLHVFSIQWWYSLISFFIRVQQLLTEMETAQKFSFDGFIEKFALKNQPCSLTQEWLIRHLLPRLRSI